MARGTCSSPHGTNSRYVNGRCRCDQCRAAASEYRRRRYYGIGAPAGSPSTVMPRIRRASLLAALGVWAQDWTDDAACQNAGLNDAHWFPESTQSPEVEEATRRKAAEALAVCQRCQVRERCLEAALSVPALQDWGVLGGTIIHDRVRIRRQRQVA